MDETHSRCSIETDLIPSRKLTRAILIISQKNVCIEINISARYSWNRSATRSSTYFIRLSKYIDFMKKDIKLYRSERYELILLLDANKTPVAPSNNI